MGMSSLSQALALVAVQLCLWSVWVPSVVSISSGDLIGQWTGSCAQRFAVVNNATSASCTTGITTMPFYAKYAMINNTLMYMSSTDGSITFPSSNTSYGFPAVQTDMTPVKFVKVSGASTSACLLATVFGIPSMAFRASVGTSIGLKTYTEEGSISFATGSQSSYCTTPATSLYCNPQTWNYICTAYMI